MGCSRRSPPDISWCISLLFRSFLVPQPILREQSLSICWVSFLNTYRSSIIRVLLRKKKKSKHSNNSSSSNVHQVPRSRLAGGDRRGAGADALRLLAAHVRPHRPAGGAGQHAVGASAPDHRRQLVQREHAARGRRPAHGLELHQLHLLRGLLQLLDRRHLLQGAQRHLQARAAVRQPRPRRRGRHDRLLHPWLPAGCFCQGLPPREQPSLLWVVFLFRIIRVGYGGD